MKYWESGKQTWGEWKEPISQPEYQQGNLELELQADGILWNAVNCAKKWKKYPKPTTYTQPKFTSYYVKLCYGF